MDINFPAIAFDSTPNKPMQNPITSTNANGTKKAAIKKCTAAMYHSGGFFLCTNTVQVYRPRTRSSPVNVDRLFTLFSQPVAPKRREVEMGVK